MQLERKYIKRRLRSSYITSALSLMLVMFVLGLLGLVVLHANRLSDFIKENIGFEIIMKDEVKAAEIIKLQKTLDLLPSVKSTEYITKEEATHRLITDLGEDFVKWVGEENNPLLPSIDVRFRAAWANNDSMASIEKMLLADRNVKEVYYQKSLVHSINSNIGRISFVLSIFTALLLLIAIALINNTIRLSVYSKRFIIRSMQLVGATESFIRTPFVVKSIFHGIIGAFVAEFLLTLVLLAAGENIPDLLVLKDLNLILQLYGVILFISITISAVSTYFAIEKYLRSKTDDLFA
jgi:cell division transport system permease protein